MTLEDFRDDLVKAYVDVHGAPYVTGTDQNDAINQALERFTEDTYCLYDDDVAFTTTNGVANYDLRDTAVFGQKMLRVMRVMVNGNQIRQVATQRDMANLSSTYILAAADVPTMWFTQGSTTLMLYPKPASTYADSYVAGWYLHPTLSDDTDVLVIPDADIQAAAIECAIALMHPRAAGKVKENLMALRQELDAMKMKIRARAQTTDAPAVIVRPKRSVYRL